MFLIFFLKFISYDSFKSYQSYINITVKKKIRLTLGRCCDNIAGMLSINKLCLSIKIFTDLPLLQFSLSYQNFQTIPRFFENRCKTFIRLSKHWCNVYKMLCNTTYLSGWSYQPLTAAKKQVEDSNQKTIYQNTESARTENHVYSIIVIL